MLTPTHVMFFCFRPRYVAAVSLFLASVLAAWRTSKCCRPSWSLILAADSCMLWTQDPRSVHLIISVDQIAELHMKDTLCKTLMYFQLNAMANRAAGKGYENEDNYCNIKFQFIGIENIHVMRNSQQKLIEGVVLSPFY